MNDVLASNAPPCYIAAPFADPTAGGVARNIARASMLGRLALSEGLAPIVVHGLIPHLFGEETPQNRAAGLRWSAALLGLVARHTGGSLWILEQDDGALSDGVAGELALWRTTRAGTNPLRHVRRATWAEWLLPLRGRGLIGGTLELGNFGLPPAGRSEPSSPRRVAGRPARQVIGTPTGLYLDGDAIHVWCGNEPPDQPWRLDAHDGRGGYRALSTAGVDRWATQEAALEAARDMETTRIAP